MSIQPLPLRSGRREVMAEAQAPITRQLTAEARRLAGRALVRVADYLYEIGAPLVRCRDDLALALSHDERESEYEAQAVALLSECGRCRLTALPLLQRAEEYDDLERASVERADREAGEAQVYLRAVSAQTESRLLGGGPEGDAA